MEPPGGGVAEVRLYRRRSHGAELLASLELVAPPRLLEADPDPPVAEDVDGDLGRCAGFYLALVQDGRVVDVARLLHYSGEPADPEDFEEDYWETGSNTSPDERPRRAPVVFPYRLSSSEDDQSSGDDGSSSSRSRSSKEDPGKSSKVDGDLSSSSEECPDNSSSSSQEYPGNSSSSSQEYPGNSSSSSQEYPAKDIWDGSYKEDDDRLDDGKDIPANPPPPRNVFQYRSSSSSSNSCEDVPGKGNAEDRCLTSRNSSEKDLVKTTAEDRGSTSSSDGYAGKSSTEDSSSSSSQGYPGKNSLKDERIDVDIWDRGSDKRDDDDEEEDDDDEAEDDGDGEEKNDGWKLSLRLWPAKKHIRLDIFSGENWIGIEVYRLTWISEEELEELFKSSFKMDIGAPIAANTVFRIQDCTMDFELSMIYTPNFYELVSELKASVRDFKFCQKIGGEGDCRVFKCLLEGGKFALKTVRLKDEEPCTVQPREVLIISSLKDKRVMKFYKAWVEPWVYKKRPIADYLFIQLELCSSTLKDLLLPEKFNTNLDRWNLAEEIAKAVKTIHDESIVHRDLKPDNVFFGADMGVRIGDFGDSCIGHDELGGYGGTPGLGTPYYSAPELAFPQKITEKVDTYSVGVMFLEIFTRFRTFFQRREAFGGLINGAIPDSCCALVGDREGARGLVKRMTAVEPAYRPSDIEILEYIQQNTSEELGDGVDGSKATDEATPYVQQITSQELGDGVDGSQAEG